MTDRRERAAAAAMNGCAAMVFALKALDRPTALAALRIAVLTLEPQLTAEELAGCLETLEEHHRRVAEHRKGLDQS